MPIERITIRLLVFSLTAFAVRPSPLAPHSSPLIRAPRLSSLGRRSGFECFNHLQSTDGGVPGHVLAAGGAVEGRDAVTHAEVEPVRAAAQLEQGEAVAAKSGGGGRRLLPGAVQAADIAVHRLHVAG